jgi:hypothetical protein
MPANQMCEGGKVDGVPMCRTHGVNLVDRATLESLNLKLEHPPVGTMFCPVSGHGLAPSPEVDDFLEPR